MIDKSHISKFRPIYLPNPVARQAPLNRGLVAWWKVLPGLSGGQYFYDLLGLNKGTLVNMGAGSGWGGSPAPGGFGSLRFDGTNDYVALPSFTLGTAWTISLWEKTTGDNIVMGNSGANIQVRVGQGAGNTISLYDGTNNPISSTFANARGTWRRIAYNGNTGTVSFFENGIARGTGTITTFTINTLGMYLSNLWANGSLDSIKIYSRALTPAEVWAEYIDERLSNPLTLNRLGGSLSAAQIARIMAQNHMLGIHARRAS